MGLETGRLGRLVSLIALSTCLTEGCVVEIPTQEIPEASTTSAEGASALVKIAAGLPKPIQCEELRYQIEMLGISFGAEILPDGDTIMLGPSTEIKLTEDQVIVDGETGEIRIKALRVTFLDPPSEPEEEPTGQSKGQFRGTIVLPCEDEKEE